MARKIELKTVDFKDIGKDGKGETPTFSYVSQLIEIVQSPIPGQGLSMDQVLRAGPILAKLKQQQEVEAREVIFEDAEFDIIMERMKTFRFGIVHPVVVQFINNIIDAPTVEVGEKK